MAPPMPTEELRLFRVKVDAAIRQCAEACAGREVAPNARHDGECTFLEYVDVGKGECFSDVSRIFDACGKTEHMHEISFKTSTLHVNALQEFEVLKAIYDLTGEKYGNNETCITAQWQVLQLLQDCVDTAVGRLEYYAETGIEPPSPLPSAISVDIFPPSLLPPSSPPPSSPATSQTLVEYSDFNSPPAPPSSPAPAPRPAARMSCGRKRRARLAPLVLPARSPPVASSSRVTVEAFENNHRRKVSIESDLPRKKSKLEVIDLTCNEVIDLTCDK